MGMVETVQGMTQRREVPRMDSAGPNLVNGPEGGSVEGSRVRVRVEGGKQGVETQRPRGGNTAAPWAVISAGGTEGGPEGSSRMCSLRGLVSIS